MAAQLKDLFKAGFPLIYIESLDTEGVERQVRQTLVELQREGRCDQDGNCIEPLFGSWTHTQKLNVDRLNPTLNMNGVSLSRQNKAVLFNGAIEFIRDSPDPVVVVFHHVGSLITGPNVIQLLLDAAQAAKHKYSTMIFVGQAANIPVELQSTFQWHSFPLPTKEELIDLCLEKIIIPNLDQVILNKPDDFDTMEKGALKKKLFKMNSELLTDLARAATGLDPIAAENAFALTLVISNPLDPNIVREQKRQIVKQSDVLEFIPLEETMADVGGFDAYQEWLARRRHSFSDDAKQFGVSTPKGVLFVGISGTGKSLAAKATASALKLSLLRFDMSKVFGSLVGQSEARMRNALRVAEGAAPVVLWLDELEKGISGSKSGDHDSGVTAKVVGQFLQWRAETKAEIFVCCTSNDIHAIPPEFYRPGRIDAVFFVGMPDLKARIEILGIHLNKRQRDPATIDLLQVAKHLEGFTGAEIEQVVVESLFIAYNRGKVDLTTEILFEAADQIVPQNIRNREEITELLNWAKDRALNVASPEVKQPSKKRSLSI